MNSKTSTPHDRLRLSTRRAQKSCGPCRARKVKCDRNSPCIRCIKSGYPDLCLYDRQSRPSPSASLDPPLQSAGHTASVSRSHRINRVAPEVHVRQSAFTTTEGLEAGQNEEQDGRRPYLGSNSLPQFLDSETAVPDATSSHGITPQGARDAVMPMLGMSPLVPGYPFFVASENIEQHVITKLHCSLPMSKEIIR